MVQVRKLGLVIRDLKIFANLAVEFLTALIVNTAYRFNFRRLTLFYLALKFGRLVGTRRFVCLDPTQHFIIYELCGLGTPLINTFEKRHFSKLSFDALVAQFLSVHFSLKPQNHYFKYLS